MKLRPYQQECLDAIPEGGSHLIQMATGLGKTVTFANIPRPGRTLILSHRDELVHQPQKYFDCSFGVEQAGESSHGEDVVSASVQSLVRRLNRFSPTDFDIIITDECQHAAAKSYRLIYNYFKPRLHLGFTATPNRGDNVRLDDVFEDIIFERDLKWGIENGYLSDIYCLRANIGYDLSHVATKMGDYAQGELSRAMNQDFISDGIAEVYSRYAKGATLIFASSVEHATEIAKRIDGAVVISATTKNRGEFIEKFTRREIPCLVNCMIFTEGTDIPLVETIMIARPTKNSSLYCLDENTEVMTDRGWKSDGEIFVGDRLAAFNMDTEQILWSECLSTVSRNIKPDETFYSIDGVSTDIRVTNKHRMVCKTRRAKAGWGIRTAEEASLLKDGFCIPVSGHMGFPGTPLTDDEIRFIGWVMTDGCINRQNHAITITQSPKSGNCDEIKRVIQSCGFKFGEHLIEGKTNFSNHRGIMVYTISRGKPRGRDKHLTGWERLEKWISKDFAEPLFNSIDERQFAVLLEAIHLADGAKQVGRSWERKSYHIAKGNKRFIERLQIACVLRGWRANLHIETLNREKPLYMLHIKNVSQNCISSSYDGRPVFSDEKMYSNEKCWCVENEHGTIVTRRNGKVSIVGNCQMVGRGVRLAPGKDRLTLIDCVGVTAKADLCTAPTLIGVTMQGVPDHMADKIEGDLFDLGGKIERYADCPSSWIKNIKLVDLWAKEQQYKTHNLNLFKMPGGDLVCRLPNKTYEIKAQNELGKTVFLGEKMPMQTALDSLYRILNECHSEQKPIWDLSVAKRSWGGHLASDKQMQMVRRRVKGLENTTLTKLEASQILNRVLYRG